MEVTSLCVRLLIHALMFIGSRDQRCHCAETAAFLRVAPNKLQFFEFDSLSFHCEGFNESTEWRVWRTFRDIKTICGVDWETSRRPCVIEDAYETDSGEYWCDAKETGRTDSVYISVTAGSVILESPALPVIEGDDVSLICRNKMASSVAVADFYKDGILTDTGYEGNTTIHNVSKADEGLYKCEIPGVGQSAVSRLTVRESYKRNKNVPPSLHEEKNASDHQYHNILIPSIPVALSLLGLLLLLVVLYKQKVLVCKSSKSSVLSDSPEAQRVSGSTAAVCPPTGTYQSITVACSAEPGVHSFTGTPQIDQSTFDENVYYSTID